jgi:hypothetical protein
MVKGKELNQHKLSELVRRSDFPLLNRFGISLLMGYENQPTERQYFPYGKGLTALYRCDRRSLVQGQNQILKDALLKTVADEYEDPSDWQLAQYMLRYFEEKTYQKCPLNFDSVEIAGEDDVSNNQ